VREKGGERDVRNLGKPVELCARYFEEGADEVGAIEEVKRMVAAGAGGSSSSRSLPPSPPSQVTFLNITGFRDCPLSDMPMLEVLRQASERVFVPLTVGGGIKGMTIDGKSYSALEVCACVCVCVCACALANKEGGAVLLLCPGRSSRPPFAGQSIAPGIGEGSPFFVSLEALLLPFCADTIPYLPHHLSSSSVI
jgi:hypothetical protein